MTKFKDIIFEPNVAIHCPEEWMANELLEYADSKGYRWLFKNKHLEDTFWYVHQENTAYQMTLVAFNNIDEFKRRCFKILHYNDVMIKEGELMETKLKYEMFIKGRRAIIGSKFFYKGETEAIIESIEIDSEGWAIIFIANSSLEGIIENEIEETFFWEKKIIYQLPDTDGNLSEVKIGQHVWVKYKYGNVYKCVISGFDGNNIEIMDICDNGKVHASNKEGLTFTGGIVTTNKPSRFIGKQDWSQAPEKVVAWGIDRDGYAYWYFSKPTEGYSYWSANDWKQAGYRNDLINDRENMEVTDWKESLVMRPKNV